DPDRHVGAVRVRLDDETADVVRDAVVLGNPATPDGADGPDGVVGALAAPLERNAECVEFLAQRSHAHTEHESSVAHAVELPVALRELERMVVREYEHPGHEPNRRCARREVAERCQRIPVRGAPTTDL